MFSSQCMDIYHSALREVLDGPGGDTLRTVIGDEAADALLADASMSEEEIALRETESGLMARYYEATDPESLATILLELVAERIRQLRGLRLRGHVPALVRTGRDGGLHGPGQGFRRGPVHADPRGPG